MIYTTGRQAGATDTFRKNYFFDVDALPTYSHTWVILGDGHEDYLDFHQNMAFNLNQINGFEDPPFFSNNCNVSAGCRATANVKLNSPYAEMECGGCENTSYAGNIDFDTGNPAGSAEFIAEYQEMWGLLCTGRLPGPNPLPGAGELQSRLGDIIAQFGGILPSCDSASSGDPAQETQTPAESVPAVEEPSSTWRLVDDRNAAIVYHGPWEEVAYDSAYQGTVTWAGEEGMDASFTFIGTQIRVYIWQFEEAQRFNIYLDGQFILSVTVPSGEEGSYLAWESENLPSANHTITVEFDDSEFHFDAFEILNAGN